MRELCIIPEKVLFKWEETIEQELISFETIEYTSGTLREIIYSEYEYLESTPHIWDIEERVTEHNNFVLMDVIPQILNETFGVENYHDAVSEDDWLTEESMILDDLWTRYELGFVDLLIIDALHKIDRSALIGRYARGNSSAIEAVIFPAQSILCGEFNQNNDYDTFHLEDRIDATDIYYRLSGDEVKQNYLGGR